MLGAVNAPLEDMSLNVGSMTYGLAHLAKGSKVYRDFLRQSEKFTILDNAADELGVGMSGGDLWNLVQEIRPDELILPDVLKDKDQTIKNSREFYQEFIERNSMEFVPESLMAVAQGSTYDEFIECYNTWYEDKTITVIGIPYDIDFELPFFQASSKVDKTNLRGVRRLQLVRSLSVNSSTNKKPIHLLGMNNLWELRQYAYHDIRQVRSNDSTGPFAAAHDDQDWAQKRENFQKDWPAMDFNKLWTRDQKEMAFRNLVKYASAIGDMNLAFNAGYAYSGEESDD